MTADVNVTEKVARALFEHRLATGDFVDGPTAWDDLPEPWRDEWHEGAAAALAALSDPEVLAGMAEVLVHKIYPAHDPDECCDEWQRDHAERVATALADWLRGTDDPDTPVTVYEEEET